MYHCGLKSSERIWKYASTMALLAYISLQKKYTRERAWSMCIYIQNHNTKAGIGEFIYNPLTLYGKQLLLKCELIMKLQKCQKYLPGKDILLNLAT